MLLDEQDNVSIKRGMPVFNTDNSFSLVSVTGETVPLYYFSGTTKTVDAGQSAGVAVYGKIEYAPIMNAIGSRIGNKGNTSLSFTCTAFTTEVPFPQTKFQQGLYGTSKEELDLIVDGFANGEYCIDYRTGMIYGKKATTVATMTAVAYMRPSSSGSSTGGGGSSSVSAKYISPSDFTATYTSDSTITISGLVAGLNIINSSQIVYVKVYNTSTKIATTYVAGSGDISFGYSAGVITIYQDGVAITALTTYDTYEVGINGQEKAYDPTVDVTKTIDQSPLSAKYVADSLVDTTNSSGTVYYPSSTGMSMDGYRSASFSGKFIDADNTTTMTIEATNDEDTTSGDWQDVTICFNNDKAGVATSIGASIVATSATTNFAISREDFNYSYFRVKVVYGDATNTSIIKLRRKAM